MYRRRASILPEIRVLAPSLERGLDDSWPLTSQVQTPSVQSLQIYQSREDITRSESSRYIPDEIERTNNKPNSHSIQNKIEAQTETLFYFVKHLYIQYSSCVWYITASLFIACFFH